MLAFIKKIIVSLFRKFNFIILKNSFYLSLVNAVGSTRSWVWHEGVRGRMDLRLTITPEVNPTKFDLEITSRLIEAYHAARKEEVRRGFAKDADEWKSLLGEKHEEFVRLISERNVSEVARILCNMNGHDITHGLSIGAEGLKIFQEKEEFNCSFAQYNFDLLLSLAEAFGISAIENPEQGPWNENIHSSHDSLAKKISSHIGFELGLPNKMGLQAGFECNNRNLQPRDFFSVYLAHFIKQLVSQNNLAGGGVICEIGSGIGKLIYYLKKFNLQTIYSFDLPYVQILAAFEVMRAFPDKKIKLYGEEVLNPEFIFLPYFLFSEQPENTFDIVVNQDSMPEIMESIVIDYLKAIKKNTKSFFVSVNQESKPPRHGKDKQNRVFDLVQKVGGYKLFSRNLFWIRKGYVEEVFKIL